MKKVTLMLVVMALLTLTAIGVSAAGSDSVDDITPSETGKYSVTYTGTEGEMYGFVVIEGDATTASTSGKIVYIDQQTAGTGGALNFADFGLLDLDPTAEDYDTVCTVFIGGGSLETATAIAELVPTPASVVPEPPSGDGVTVSGTITDTVAGAAKDATVKLIAADATETTATAAKDASKTNSYSFTGVAAGTYSLKITKDSFLSYTITGITVADSAVTIPAVDISKMAGDLDTDNMVRFSDLSALLDEYNDTGVSSAADIDGDTMVVFADLSALLDGYNGDSVTYPM